MSTQAASRQKDAWKFPWGYCSCASNTHAQSRLQNSMPSLALSGSHVMITSQRRSSSNEDVVHVIAYACTKQVPGVTVGETHWPRKGSCEILRFPHARCRSAVRRNVGTLANSWMTRDCIQDSHRQRNPTLTSATMHRILRDTAWSAGSATLANYGKRL